MKKLSVFTILLSTLAAAQSISSSRWTDLFSYNNVLAVRQTADGKLIAATENGIFYYNPANGEISKLSKANGLHQVKISAFDFNAETNTGLVGYTNGSMDVIRPDGITYIVDIPIANGYTGRKNINHIAITGNLATVSVDYGVSVFNLDKKEFGDTAFFTSGSLYEAAKEAVIKDNTVFAVTSTGLKKHALNVTFPIYSEWQTVASGNFTNIDIESGTIAYSNSNQVWYGDGSTFTALLQSFAAISDVTVTPNNIVVADGKSVKSFVNGSSSDTFSSEKTLNTAWYSGQIFSGSSADGLLDRQGKSYKPDGPPYSNAFGITLLNNNAFLVSTGARDEGYWTPKWDSRNIGLYYFNGQNWVYPNYFLNSDIRFNILDSIEFPPKSSTIYFANFTEESAQGIYKMQISADKNSVDFVKKYDKSSPVGFTIDDASHLYAVSTLWTDYGIYQPSAESFFFKGLKSSSVAPGRPKYYNGMLWLPSPRGNNLTVANLNGTPENFSDDIIYTLTKDNNLPESTRVICVAFDQDDTAWIGTLGGLRILEDASESIKTNPQLETIVITQNGIGEELFRNSQILHIEVDGGNQKWVSVNGGGAFYLNASGGKTLLNFTKDNSPLPNNTITDIKVDSKSGRVYFVTNEGIVVYNGDISEVDSTFRNVLVYPNPVIYAQYKGNAHIRGLADKTNIRITDVAGNLVHQAIARGGTYEWDLTSKGKRVASGIYFVLMTNGDGTETATAKIAVVN